MSNGELAQIYNALYQEMQLVVESNERVIKSNLLNSPYVSEEYKQTLANDLGTYVGLNMSPQNLDQEKEGLSGNILK